jgi:hypothetical protein
MKRVVARRPVLAFMVISLGVGFLTSAGRPNAGADVLLFGLPLHGFLGGLIGRSGICRTTSLKKVGESRR